MRVLLDTNILTRLSQPSSAQHAATRSAVQILTQQRHILVVVPQVIAEFWAVASRPNDERGGLGWNTATVRAAVDAYLVSFNLYEDTSELFSLWLDLVTRNSVSGVQTHDAKLAAACLVHGFNTLLTHNGKDFKRFGLNVLDPAEVQQGDPTP